MPETFDIPTDADVVVLVRLLLLERPELTIAEIVAKVGQRVLAERPAVAARGAA